MSLCYHGGMTRRAIPVRGMLDVPYISAFRPVRRKLLAVVIIVRFRVVAFARCHFTLSLYAATKSLPIFFDERKFGLILFCHVTLQKHYRHF